MVMKPDLPLTPSVWHDFYAVTGYAPGADVICCNRSGTRILVYEGDQPPANALYGWEIPPGGGVRVKAQSAWIRGNAAVILGGLQEVVE